MFTGKSMHLIYLDKCIINLGYIKTLKKLTFYFFTFRSRANKVKLKFLSNSLAFSVCKTHLATNS